MPDKHEVGGSSPLEPTSSESLQPQKAKCRNEQKRTVVKKRKIIENRIKILKRTDNFFKILKSGFSEKEIG